MSEINVTPFVDVMLVLLIIFMVAAPLLTVGVPIDLPETQAKALNSETQPITISVNEGGQIYLQETEIPLDEVVPKLQAIAAGRLRGAHLCARRQDRRLRHGDEGDGAHLGGRLPQYRPGDAAGTGRHVAQMKAGLTTSVVMHAALLGFGLFSLSAPSAFEVADVEALPVDIVPVE